MTGPPRCPPRPPRPGTPLTRPAQGRVSLTETRPATYYGFRRTNRAICGPETRLTNEMS
jgi:hypothetical protein